MPRKQVIVQPTSSAAGERITKARAPLIFISHDSRDATLAEAFENLLTDASGGVLKAFRSSDRKGSSGIEFGAEWYATIMSKLGEATDVVALITPRSLGRPWILYEVGVARGKLNTPAFGIGFGVSLDQIVGPFAQFQNSPDDEDSLTKLVLQLIRRNPDAAPREEAVRRQVAAFREQLPKLTNSQEEVTPTEASDVAKLFEEVKAMFRELPSQLRDELRRERLQADAGLGREDWVRRGLKIMDRLSEAEGIARAERWSEFAGWFWEDLDEPDFEKPAYQVYKALRGESDTDLASAHRILLDYAEELDARGGHPRDKQEVDYFLRRAADLVSRWSAGNSATDSKAKRRPK